MYPILFRIWNFPVNTYGVFLALAFLGAIFVTVKLAERDGLPKARIYDLCLWLLLSSLIGSKVLMFFTEPEYREHPLQLFSLDFLRSGGVFYGGLLGAMITGYFLMRRWKLPWWKTADACAPGIALGNVLGRFGFGATAPLNHVRERTICERGSRRSQTRAERRRRREPAKSDGILIYRAAHARSQILVARTFA